MNDGLRIIGLWIGAAVAMCEIYLISLPPAAYIGLGFCAIYQACSAIALMERADKPRKEAEEDLIYAQIFKEDL